jgi:hypothetical protein
MHVNFAKIDDLRRLAATRLPRVVFDFINDGGGNQAAFKRGVSQ